MQTNMTSDQLYETLKMVVSPDSSIGVHNVWARDSEKSNLELASNILQNGLKITNRSYGIVGNVKMLGSINEFDQNDAYNLTKYSYGYQEDSDIVTIVVAIPETLKLLDDTEVYLGKYLKFDGGYGKDDTRALSMPINYLEVLPQEFIVGVYHSKMNESLGDFIINQSYIGLRTEEEQKLFNTQFFDSIKAISRDWLKFDTDSFLLALRRISMSQILFDGKSDFYVESFVEKYDEQIQIKK